MRIDAALVTLGLVESRTKAQLALAKNLVAYNGVIITKPSFVVTDSAFVTLVQQPLRYVSRGGDKLKLAIDTFNLNFDKTTVLDVGASTGGFTDCALQHGAQRVVCVDVGSNQLHATLQNHANVTWHENQDIRTFKTKLKFDYIVVDVSFINIEAIVVTLIKLMQPSTQLVLLVKPQFEQAKRTNFRKGIIKDERVQQFSVKNVIQLLADNNLTTLSSVSTHGLSEDKERNIEFLLHVTLATN
jgi:23S rRNA (cytidine1920-2'-O)/16S rRNA (cytidine1409-2'-O)-methyltransferase